MIRRALAALTSATVVLLVFSSPARTHVEGTFGFCAGAPPNGAAEALAVASFARSGWSCDVSLSLAALPDHEAKLSVGFSVIRGSLTLTSTATFEETLDRCQSLDVMLSGLTTSLRLCRIPPIELEISAKLGTIAIPDSIPCSTLVATLSMGEHWLRFDSPSQLTGSLTLYNDARANDEDRPGLRISADCIGTLLPPRISTVSLGAQLDREETWIMASIGHSAAIPFSVSSSIQTESGPIQLSAWASLIPSATTPLRITAKAVFAW